MNSKKTKIALSVIYFIEVNSRIAGFFYITNYDAGLRYAVRSADDGVLSDEKIVVDTPVTGPFPP